MTITENLIRDAKVRFDRIPQDELRRTVQARCSRTVNVAVSIGNVMRRITGSTAIALAIVLIVASAAYAVDYSERFFDDTTDYDVWHWTAPYQSRGGEASATPNVWNTICGHRVHTTAADAATNPVEMSSSSGYYSEIECSTAASWSNQIEYEQQRAVSSCAIHDKGWGGSSINLTCSKGK